MSEGNDGASLAAWNDPGRLPPELRALWIVTQKYAAQAIYALAELGVADLLALGPRTIAELAASCQANASALYRVLRCTASVGVFTELADGRFALTPEAKVLCRDHPASLRDVVLLHGRDLTWRPYGEILYSVRTGRPAFDRVFGMPIFDYLAAHPDDGELVFSAVAAAAHKTANGYLAVCDFGRFSHIADVGGGDGHLLSLLLSNNPRATGLLFDRGIQIDRAKKLFEQHAVADRVTITEGDFFAGVPEGYDAYILRSVLHDWPDAHAETILRRVRQAIGEDRAARLLILDFVLSPDNEPDQGKLLDIHMLVTFGGRERTLAEWRDLIERTGFELAAEPVLGTWPVLECRPVSGVST